MAQGKAAGLSGGFFYPADVQPADIAARLVCPADVSARPVRLSAVSIRRIHSAVFFIRQIYLKTGIPGDISVF